MMPDRLLAHARVDRKRKESRKSKKRHRAPRTPLTRSQIMARVKRRDTSPERVLRSSLHAAGLRFRVDRRIEGIHADIVFPTAKVAIFVDGCFWHSCPVHATTPKSNTSYWLPKLEENRRRDLRQTTSLRRFGWLVIRIWEHDCRLPTHRLIKRIVGAITKRLRPAQVNLRADVR